MSNIILYNTCTTCNGTNDFEGGDCPTCEPVYVIEFGQTVEDIKALTTRNIGLEKLLQTMLSIASNYNTLGDTLLDEVDTVVSQLLNP